MSFTYKGLTASYDRHLVTDDEVTRQLHRLQQSNARIAKITDRPTALGDEVVLDYAGYCDGVQFPGGTAQNQTLVLGSGMFIPGFEQQLVDKVVEEKVTVNVTFPAEYHAKELAGKDAQFQCVIHEIRVKTPYELDDTFAKEVGGCDTLEEMRKRVVLYACMDTLEYLYKGGRISGAVYRVGSLAQIKPILQVDAEGKLAIPAKAMGMKKGMAFMCEKVKELPPDGEFPFYVMYTNNRSVAEALAAKLAAAGIPVPDERIIQVGAGIGSHVGPDACGLVYVAAKLL